MDSPRSEPIIPSEVIGAPNPGFRRAEKPEGEWHIALDLSADGGHWPAWSAWVPDLMAESRRCVMPGCGIVDVRARESKPLEAAGVPSAAPIPLQVGEVAGEPITAEVMVGGRGHDPFAAAPGCEHRVFNQQVVIAQLMDDSEAGDPTRRVGWRAQLKVRCAECGCSFRFKKRAEGPVDAATSADGVTLGVLIEPVPAEPEEIGWSLTPAALGR